MTEKAKKKYYRDFGGELRFIVHELENLAGNIEDVDEREEMASVINHVWIAAAKLESMERGTVHCSTCVYRFTSCPAGASREDCAKWEPA